MSNRRSRTPRLRLTAVAAVAVSLPLVLAAPALAAPVTPPAPLPTPTHAAAATVPAGTVVQQSVPELIADASTVTTRFTATLPTGTTGQVSALLAFDDAQLPPAGWTSSRVAAGLHASCAVDGGPFQDCSWAGGTADENPVEAYLRLPLPAAPAGRTLTYDVRLSAAYRTLPEDQLLDGWIELTDADGDALAVGGAQIQYRKGVMPASDRGALYARDAGGVLWRYEGNDTSLTGVPLKARAAVGGGWNAYTLIVPLGGQSAGAQGDLVARDRDGVLWYYRHSGDPAKPFQARVRVGGGWNAYTALSPVTGVSYRAGDLVGRDRTGTLWRYRATGDPAKPFQARVRVGGGWNTYTTLTGYGSAIVARDTAGVLWSYPPNWDQRAADPFGPRVRVGPGWNAYTAFSGTVIGRQGYGESLFARDGAGRLWWYGEKASGVPSGRTLVGSGWNIYTVIF